MAINEAKLHLLAYDISDPKRLQRVHRAVSQVGIPLQYSVFLVTGKASDLDELLRDLRAIIEPVEDDIRVYPLPRRLEAERFGRQQLPRGIDLIRGDHLHDGLLALVGEPDAG